MSTVILATAGAFAADETKKEPKIPICEKSLGALAVTEPENKWWLAHNLQSPEALIKVFVAQSKCFTLLDRGKGMAAAQAERALTAGSEIRARSNTGNRQTNTADYVLVPEMVNQTTRAVGKSEAIDVVLRLTDARSAEQVAIVQGHAKKTELGRGGSAFFRDFAAEAVSSYANTEIGRTVTMAYLDAFTKWVAEARNRDRDNAGVLR
jgi:hypothetical protein